MAWEKKSYRNSQLHRAQLEILLEYRKKAGMTQQELADELGRSEDWVSKVEHGVRMLNSIELIIYAHALKSTAAEIHTETERRVILKRNPTKLRSRTVGST